jgi:hypothetical protein
MFGVWLVYLYKLPTQTKLVFFLNYEEQNVLLSPESWPSYAYACEASGELNTR